MAAAGADPIVPGCRSVLKTPLSLKHRGRRKCQCDVEQKPKNGWSMMVYYVMQVRISPNTTMLFHLCSLHRFLEKFLVDLVMLELLGHVNIIRCPSTCRIYAVV
jgi:hypothetical protein